MVPAFCAPMTRNDSSNDDGDDDDGDVDVDVDDLFILTS